MISRQTFESNVRNSTWWKRVKLIRQISSYAVYCWSCFRRCVNLSPPSYTVTSGRAARYLVSVLKHFHFPLYLSIWSKNISRRSSRVRHGLCETKNVVPDISVAFYLSICIFYIFVYLHSILSFDCADEKRKSIICHQTRSRYFAQKQKYNQHWTCHALHGKREGFSAQHRWSVIFRKISSPNGLQRLTREKRTSAFVSYCWQCTTKIRQKAGHKRYMVEILQSEKGETLRIHTYF